MALDKNPEQISDDDLVHIRNEFEKNAPSMVLCSEAFEKMEFLNRLISSAGMPVIYVDTDLLYTGYVRSGMIQRGQNVEIFCPDRTSWRSELSEITSTASEGKILVVIDSFNGVYNMFGDLESAVFVNSCIMLLSSVARQAASPVIVAAMARKKESEWVVSPGGRQIIKSAKTRLYILQKIKNDLLVETEDKIFRIGS